MNGIFGRKGIAKATIRKQTYICEDIQIKVLFQVKVFNRLW